MSRTALDDPNIGVLHLSCLASVDELTFSATTASAPKDAQNAYEKGIDNAKKQKWTDAERDFLKAVQVYPRYAVAWYELGRVYQQEKKFDDAARALNEAIKIDPEFVSPYGQLRFWRPYKANGMTLSRTPHSRSSSAPRFRRCLLLQRSGARQPAPDRPRQDHARQAATLDTRTGSPRRITFWE